MRAYLVKDSSGALRASSPADQDNLDKLPSGQALRAEITRETNAAYRRKYHAMIDFAFDNWDPPAKYEAVHDCPRKDREQFRKEIQILAGFGYPVFRLDGSYTMEAKSISFAQLADDQEFEESVYSPVAQVILDKILTNYSRNDLDQVINKMVGFL